MNGKKVIPAQQHDWLSPSGLVVLKQMIDFWSLLTGVVDVLLSPADGIISYIY